MSQYTINRNFSANNIIFDSSRNVINKLNLIGAQNFNIKFQTVSSKIIETKKKDFPRKKNFDVQYMM